MGVKGFFGGGRPPPAPQLPPLPPPREIMDVIDEISGTKYVEATDPVTGRKIRILQNLPRSPQEQALYDQAGKLMDTAISEMKRLYDYDPSQIVNFRPFVETLNTLNAERGQDIQRLTRLPDFTRYVEDFQNMQRSIYDEELNRRKDVLMEDLNRSGYGKDSTAAKGYLAALENERAKTHQRLGVESLGYASDLRNRLLQQNASEYALTEQGRQDKTNSAFQEYQLEQQHAQDLQNQRNQALSHQQNLYTIGSNIRAADLAKRQNTQAPNLALNEFQIQNQNDLARHNAEASRMTAQHQMDMNAYKAKPPTFGQTMMGLAPVVIGGMLGGPAGAAAGGMISQGMNQNATTDQGLPVGQIGKRTAPGVTTYGVPL